MSPTAHNERILLCAPLAVPGQLSEKSRYRSLDRSARIWPSLCRDGWYAHLISHFIRPNFLFPPPGGIVWAPLTLVVEFVNGGSVFVLFSDGDLENHLVYNEL
jgi:hypothetical protein